ncbi:hypothetical protein HPP92_011349 [Vanilla planifolia]|uniref:polyribonucleotide nucleotidyltransferase n=1 Tax=Vanilla planifolia TaxID=51239 RepID=A0A835V4C3_VANPL|nr:hypothetical protein HPP92_011349 [Vanilla planifolia]
MFKLVRSQKQTLKLPLKLAHPEAVKYIDPQIRLAQRAGKMKKEYTLSMIMNKAVEKIRNYVEEPIEAVFTDATYGKFERGEALDRITEGVRVKIEEEFDEECLKVLQKVVDNIRKQVVRKRIIEKGLRVDGRKLDEVRPLYCESGTYPILHGSSIFSRGDTQVLCTVTIGAPGDAQKLDSLVGPPTKRFMLHYSFPPFCINEVGKRVGLNRREVGHGTLAEKALLAVLPPEDDFKYTVRINSEVMSSDGSTSMATVCGGSMALMDAGIPVREHVAGLSVGLVCEVDPTTGIVKDYRILTDILGLEDHLGDMDFKIAGTKNGITAIQLDIKPAGIPLNIICECLGVARKGRIQILDRMEEEISAPRSMNDGNAPRLATMKLDEESLRRLLGPLGLHRKKIEKETGARIAVSDGIVTIVAKNHIIMEKAQQKVDFLVGREIQVGRIYKGIVSSIKEYGAFVELNGGQQGLLHISELSHELPSKVSDAVSVGQELSVMCIGQDVRGNIKLSLKATLPLRGSINLSAGSSDVSFCAEGGNLNVSKTETDIENAAYSTPSIIIRSAAECETQDGAKTWNSTEKTSRKSLPKPYNPVSSQSGTVGFGRFNSNVSPEQKAANLLRMAHIKKERDSISVDVYKQESEECTSKYKTKSSGMANHQNNSLKLGDEVTAKIYQIRTHGLVLEVGGGLRGMYKFEANGRKDFEVGEMILAKCSSFSDKGIPVFSLFEDKS